MPSDLSIFGTQKPVYDDRMKFFFIRLFMKLGMKNPYEEKKVEFSPELLTTKAHEIRAISKHYDLCVNKMRLLVGDLETLWQNDIQSSFIAELGNMQSSIMEFPVIADEYAALLDFVSSELSLKRISIDKSSDLSGKDDEPINVVLSKTPDLKKPYDIHETEGSFGKQCDSHTKADKSFLYYIFKPLSIFGIKNPYAQSNEQFSPKSLENRALEMRSITSQYDYNVRKMQYMIEDLEKIWQNEAQTSIIQKLENLHSALKDYSNLSDEFASLLEMAALELQTSNIDADKASVL